MPRRGRLGRFISIPGKAHHPPRSLGKRPFVGVGDRGAAPRPHQRWKEGQGRPGLDGDRYAGRCGHLERPLVGVGLTRIENDQGGRRRIWFKQNEGRKEGLSTSTSLWAQDLALCGGGGRHLLFGPMAMTGSGRRKTKQGRTPHAGVWGMVFTFGSNWKGAGHAPKPLPIPMKAGLQERNPHRSHRLRHFGNMNTLNFDESDSPNRERRIDRPPSNRMLEGISRTSTPYPPPGRRGKGREGRMSCTREVLASQSHRSVMIRPSYQAQARLPRVYSISHSAAG